MGHGGPAESTVSRLEATASTVHFGFFDAALPPVLEIDSGDELWVSCGQIFRSDQQLD